MRARARVCVWNFAANLVNILQRHFICKIQSSQWIGKGSLDQIKWMSRSKIKVLFVVFFDWKDIIHHEFVPRGQMVNKQLYHGVLVRLRDAVRRKRPELWESQTWMLHHENVPASRVTPHPQLSGKTSDIRCASSTLFSGLNPSRLFPVSQT